MSNFWSWYVILLVVLNLIGFAWFTFRSSKVDPKSSYKEDELMDHDADGIQEYNREMPRWLYWMFWITFVFSIFYLVLYPGLGNFAGTLGWTSGKQLQKQENKAQKQHGDIFSAYEGTPIPSLIKNAKALKIGKGLFLRNCSNCHGSDATGSVGFPNLTNSNWLFGGKPKEIEKSILDGRHSAMPPMGAAVGNAEAINNVVAYVRSLNGLKANAQNAALGAVIFKKVCVMCHGANAKGNKLLGAPNLTNNKWIFGGSAKAIKNTIIHGHSGVMPSHKQLGKAEVHLIAAYVYSLTKGNE